MKNAVQIFEQLPQALRAALDNQLGKFAEELEEDTRNDRPWSDDTGSAADAVTAYLVGKGFPRKNFDRPNWRRAMLQGNEWTGAPYRNPPKNYWPEIHSVNVGEDKNTRVVILTSFIKYARTLEFVGSQKGYGPGYLLTQRPGAHLGHLITRLSFALLEAIRNAG